MTSATHELMDVLLVGSDSWRMIIDWVCLAGRGACLLAWGEGRWWGKWMMVVWVESVIFQMVAAKKRKAADENHVFRSKKTGKYFFCFKDIIVSLICNGK